MLLQAKVHTQSYVLFTLSPRITFFFHICNEAVILLISIYFLPLLTPLFIHYGLNNLLYIALFGWLLTYISWFIAGRSLNFKYSTSLSSSLTILAISAMFIHGLYIRLRGKKFIWKGREV